MAFVLGSKSLKALIGVDERLVSVVKRAIEITTVDFSVIEGLRTKKRQAELVAAGASKTMNSRHLTGHAVDLAPYVNGRIRWDWPLFYPIADAMKRAAQELCVPIRWGGDWMTFKDGPHFELPWSIHDEDMA